MTEEHREKENIDKHTNPQTHDPTSAVDYPENHHRPEEDQPKSKSISI